MYTANTRFFALSKEEWTREYVPVKTNPLDIYHDVTLDDGSEFLRAGPVPDHFSWKDSPEGNKAGPIYN